MARALVPDPNVAGGTPGTLAISGWHPLIPHTGDLSSSHPLRSLNPHRDRAGAAPSFGAMVGNIPAAPATMALAVIDLWRVSAGAEARFVHSGPTDGR